MHEHESPDFGMTDPELAAFESRLASLAPQSLLDRDRLMFAAGRNAAGKRLHRINRALAVTSIALSAVACFALVSLVTDEAVPNARPQLASPVPRPSTKQRAESSVALVEGPTALRLLRLWQENGQTFDDPMEGPPDDAAPPSVEAKPSPSNTSRELLLRYLRSTSERL